MQRKFLHGAGCDVSCLGLGTVKFGRNEQVKYPTGFDLPDDKAVSELLDLALEEGINLLDTAPAYGTSEERLGDLLGSTRDQWVIVSKAGEEFVDGASRFDFSSEGITRSVERSLDRLKTDRIDAVLLHSDGNDLEILNETGASEALFNLKESGKVLSVGISTKTVEGGLHAVELGMDCVMVTYNPWYLDEEPVLDAAEAVGNCSVFIKKAFGSGWFGKGHEAGELKGSPTEEALSFIFKHTAPTAVITGTINQAHLKENASVIRGLDF